MSIATEITRLQQAKADIKTAIENKGVTVPSSATLDAYDGYIDDIPSGGGNWETIGRGMVDYTTPFEIPAEILPHFGSVSVYTYMFLGRGNLKSIDFSGQIYITERICQNVGILTLTLPDTLLRIGNYAFYGCKSLTEIISEKTTPPTLGTDAFTQCTALTGIYVPDASVSAYQGATNWIKYASIIKGISERPTT